MELLSENKVLREIFETGSVPGLEGNRIKVQSQICAEFAEALYQAVLSRHPALVIEVGMAFGVASLAILTALRKSGTAGRLISIDPYQSTNWRGQGLSNVARSGLQQYHKVVEKPDFIVLPQLLTSGCKPDLAYIDGWHTFDYTLLDFYYLDKMLRMSGVVGFNDCGYPGVHKAINFVLTHRRYREVDVGLKPNYSKRQELARFFRGHWRKHFRVLHQDRYFEKAEHWEPNYDFFAEF